MTKKSKSTVKGLQTADMRPSRDYYVPDLGRTIQAGSLQERDEKIAEIKRRKAERVSQTPVKASAEDSAE